MRKMFLKEQNYDKKNFYDFGSVRQSFWFEKNSFIICHRGNMVDSVCGSFMETIWWNWIFECIFSSWNANGWVIDWWQAIGASILLLLLRFYNGKQYDPYWEIVHAHPFPPPPSQSHHERFSAAAANLKANVNRISKWNSIQTRNSKAPQLLRVWTSTSFNGHACSVQKMK